MKIVQKVLLFGFAIALGIALGESGFSLPALDALHIALFFAFMYLHIYIHEAGHVICGRIVGFTASRVVIGNGRKPLVRFTVAGTLVEITPSFSGGFTYVNVVPSGGLRARFFFFILGGVLFNAIAIAAVYLVAYPLLGSTPGGAADVFIYAGIIMAAINLLPFNIYAMGVKIPYDGLKLIKTPFMKNTEIRKLLAAGKVHRVYYLIRDREFAGAEKACLEALEFFPGDEALEINLAVVYIKLNRLDEAIDILARLEKNEKSQYRHIIANNLAYAYVLTWDETHLPAADALSDRAYRFQKRLANFRVTRGSVMLLTGRVKEGLALLGRYVKYRKGVNRDMENADTFSLYALGLHLDGRTAEAAQHAARAAERLSEMSPSEAALLGAVRRRIGLPEAAANNLAPGA